MRIVELAGTGDQWSFRRLPQALADLHIQPRHVLHIGANLGQEVPDYRAAGIERITLVEPDPETAAKLRATHPDLPVIEAACGTAAGVGMLRRIDGADVWSTLATTPMPHDHVVTNETPVDVLTVEQVQDQANDPNTGPVDMLVIDTQGTELDALRSADLSTVALVVIETQEVDSDAHAGYWPDVLAYMAECGWAPALQWRHETQGEYFATFADTFFVPVSW